MAKNRKQQPAQVVPEVKPIEQSAPETSVEQPAQVVPEVPDNSGLIAEINRLKAENEQLKIADAAKDVVQEPVAAKRHAKAYQLEDAGDGKVYGPLDVKKEYPFPKGWMGRVVVKQSEVIRFNSGHMGEDPGSIRIMNYETEVFDVLERKNLFGANTKVVILNDPR